ncbi:MAG: DUF3105 domain-containing protein [Ardenticatenaceae bacterium]|nr:DUF3105 domain-containing protein [Ardenticatenaceae bacterium]MCB8949372.1 DUF3105 domain-containing protein [Ardenticatenaceae bacterium]
MLSNRRNLIVWGMILLGVVGLAFIMYLNVRPEQPIEGVVQFPRPARGHDDTLVFETSEVPPAGGEHYNVWQNCGIYDAPIQTGNAVHAMEHGAVWITYQPDLADADVAELASITRSQTFLMLSPYEGQRSPVVLTAWGFQLEVDSADDGRIEDFIERYRLSPTTPELGGACSQGVGVPLP